MSIETLTRRIVLLAAFACASACRAQPHEPFRFAAIADVQYADKDTSGARRYRESLGMLQECVDELSQRDLEFVVHLGDVIDGREGPGSSRVDLESVLAVFAQLPQPVRWVVGNHCLAVPRAELLPRLDLERAYYAFTVEGWRFLVLDSMDLSVAGIPEDGEAYRRAEAWLAAHPRSEFPNAYRWNGGLGAEQLAWLAAELERAARDGLRVVLFAHHPVSAIASSREHLLWNHGEVRALIERSRAVVAWICGHAHSGGYVRENGIHHLTLQGMVEAPAGSTAFAVIDAFEDRLEVRGVGVVPSRVLEVRGR